MFTGIIEDIGRIKAINKNFNNFSLDISCERIAKSIKKGDSIAVNGVCFTTVCTGDDFIRADVMPETLRKTNLREIKIGNYVNLERALKYCERLGGHIVTGHIDCIGTIIKIESEKNARWVEIKPETNLAMKYLVQKGSVAIDGASLTVADLRRESFKVCLVPFTIASTVLGHKKRGDMVNIECDILAKYIDRHIGFYSAVNKSLEDGITKDYLKKHGFM